MDGWIPRPGDGYGEGWCRAGGRRTLMERLGILGLRQRCVFGQFLGSLENCWKEEFGMDDGRKVFLLKLGRGILYDNFFEQWL